MNGDPVKIALIGCGNMGNYYAHNLSRMEGVKIISCCDPSEKKLEGFRAKWNIPHGETHWYNLIHPDNPETRADAVINCTVDSLHGPIFKACLDAALPLLTEKPFAVPFDILKSVPSETLFKQTLLINFSKRSLPAVHGARDFIQKGGLGEIHRMEFHYRQGWVLNHDYGDWHDKSAWFWRLTNDYSHYGVLGDLGSHLFDLSVYFGGPADSIGCNLSRIAKGQNVLKGHQLDSWDDAVCMLHMENGASCLISASRTTAGEKDSLEILISGEKGSLRLNPEQSRDRYNLFLTGQNEWEEVHCPQRPEKNHDLFIDILKTGTSSDYTGLKAALYNQVMIEAAAEADSQNTTLKINHFGQDKLGDLWQQTNP
ncbi:MAG: Gfo/Idh/MocA family oxidoreductase [Spirochaetales bacterium]|nr:Gfo/Idh/MocA family oxidoreductase [Spirochaetales bacterium]